ncbi:MAG: hypothetical protein K0R50_3419 [Eubacterium sp.]|jgi:beta-glucanase (GH16 family)|nr:hypothetical protein [Eubacterium sp.]
MFKGYCKLRKALSLFLAVTIFLGIINVFIPKIVYADSTTVTKTSEIFYDDFDGNTLNTDKWLVAKKNWGGYEKDNEGNIISNYNGGVVPENVSLENGVLKLEAHGNNYTGDVKGVYRSGRERADNIRVGASIATKDYYASGRYEVNMKIPDELGACSAIWSFNYRELYDEASLAAAAARGVDVSEGYYVSNHEIDIELPGRPTGEVQDISYDYALCNTWRGETEVESTTNYTNVKEAMGDRLTGGELGALADGKFHTYRFDWHTGDSDTPAKVDYYIDNILIKTCTTDIPNIAGRFWVGIWFPNKWAGTPDFDTVTLDVDYLKITPFSEYNDAWDAESYPDDGWGTYPDTDSIFIKKRS